MNRIESMLAVIAILMAHTFAEVKIYSAPSQAKTSTDFSVTVDGQDLVVYKDERYYFVVFDVSGSADLTVSWTLPFTTAIIRPLSRGIEPAVSGKSASFSIPGPMNISFESNDDYADPQTVPALFIFANPFEVNIPSQDDPAVEYFGPGYHDIGAYMVTEAKKTIYLAGGAYLDGKIRVEGVDDVLIYGRGILYTSFPGGGETTEFSAISVNNCSGFRLQGITATHVDTWSWSTTFRGCSRMVVDNYHVVAYNLNDDGFQPRADWSTFNNIFSATNDDSYSLSGGDHHTYINCIARAGRARPFQIWTNSSFAFYKGCEAIGTNTSAGDCPAILFEGDGSNSNFRFENINIEIQNRWLYVTGPNHYFKNINVVYDGGSAENDGSPNLTFENLRIAGKQILNASDAPEFSSNGAIFLASNPTAPLVEITAPTTYDRCNVVTGPDFSLQFTIDNWPMAQNGKCFHYFVNNVDQGARYSADPIDISGLPIGPNSVNIKLMDESGAYTGIQDAIVVTVTNGATAHHARLPGFAAPAPRDMQYEILGIDGKRICQMRGRTGYGLNAGVYVVRSIAGHEAMPAQRFAIMK